MSASDAKHTPIASYRRLLYGAHAGLAFVAVLAFTSQSSVRNFAYPFSAFAGMGFVMSALPALLPYIVSIMTSGSWVVKSRWQVYLFLAVLVIGGIAAALITVDAFDWHIGRLGLLAMYAVQTLAYMLAAGGLLLNRPTERG